MERILVRNTGAVQSGIAGNRSFPTSTHEETDKLTSGTAKRCSNLAKPSVTNYFEEVVSQCLLLERKKATREQLSEAGAGK